MALPITMTTMCKCSFGAAPLPILVSSQSTVMMCNTLAATIMDNKFPPFGMCSSPTNPAVVAALGAPMPCSPVLAAPWMPGVPTVIVCGKPLLNNSSQLLCAYLGIIQAQAPVATTVITP